MAEDLGQGQVQARKDIEEALGYVPSDGSDLHLEGADPADLAEQQKDANKQFMNPSAGGLAAEKPTPPHSAEAASAPSGDEDDSGKPAKSASREEWDAYAESQGVDPSEFSNKDDLVAHFGS